jgi:hypothetical protein
MKRKIASLAVGFMLIGINLFAADGDLLVNGKIGIGIGTTDPVSPLEIRGSGSTRITESVVNGENGRNSSLLLRGTFTNFPSDTNQRNFGLITGGSDGTWEGSYIKFGVAGLDDCMTDGFGDPCTRMTIKQGNVGIGTENPGGKLHINDPNSGSITSIALNANGVNGANIVLSGNGETTPSKFIRVYNGSLQILNNAYNTVLLNISDSGNVGIGTPNPSNLLTMEPSGGGYYNQLTHAWVNGSSGRWKSSIKPIEGALDTVLKLNGVLFKWKKRTDIFQEGGGEAKLYVSSSWEDDPNGREDIGLIGEDVMKVLPEVVDVDQKDSKFATGVAYSKMVPLLIEAIKEQQAQIERLKSDIEALKK